MRAGKKECARKGDTRGAQLPSVYTSSCQPEITMRTAKSVAFLLFFVAAFAAFATLPAVTAFDLKNPTAKPKVTAMKQVPDAFPKVTELKPVPDAKDKVTEVKPKPDAKEKEEQKDKVEPKEPTKMKQT